MENKWKNQNFFQSLKNAINGITYVFKSGRNFKIQLVFAIFATLVGIFLNLSNIEFAILIITIVFVLVMECINTAIEKIVDMYTLEYNETAKIIKDTAAGCVTLTAILSIIIGCLLFLPKLVEIIM